MLKKISNILRFPISASEKFRLSVSRETVSVVLKNYGYDRKIKTSLSYFYDQVKNGKFFLTWDDPFYTKFGLEFFNLETKKNERLEIVANGKDAAKLCALLKMHSL